MINDCAFLIIFVWACWCIFSNRVNDGIFGKIMFSMTALAALSSALNHTAGTTTLHVCFAAIGLRHIAIKTVWPKVLDRIGYEHNRRLSDKLT